jgi:predicted ATPase
LLAEAYRYKDETDLALQQIHEALEQADRSGERVYKAEIHRLKGELLLQKAVPDAQKAEICFQRALALARQQQAKAWELRVATSIARLWQREGKHQDAHELLAPIYAWFTEGFDTADLQEAKALLEELRV